MDATMPSSADAALAEMAWIWLDRPHYGDNARMAAALRAWLERPPSTVSHS